VEAVMAAENDNAIKEWYTTAEAAEYLRCTHRALQGRVGRGKIVPDVLAGTGRGQWNLFHIDTLRAYLGRKAA
jgi:hypothetical protein